MRPVQHEEVTIELVQLSPYPFSSPAIKPGEYPRDASRHAVTEEARSAARRASSTSTSPEVAAVARAALAKMPGSPARCRPTGLRQLQRARHRLRPDRARVGRGVLDCAVSAVGQPVLPEWRGSPRSADWAAGQRLPRPEHPRLDTASVLEEPPVRGIDDGEGDRGGQAVQSQEAGPDGDQNGRGETAPAACAGRCDETSLAAQSSIVSSSRRLKLSRSRRRIDRLRRLQHCDGLRGRRRSVCGWFRSPE